MAAEKTKPFMIEEARLVFRNFTGRPGMYNNEGNRNFCVLLTPEQEQSLQEDGWNVKHLRPREEDDLPQPYLQVKVQFGKYPPHIMLITSKGKTDLTENDVSLLDWAEINRVDLIVRPFTWERSDGKHGISAYLKSIYVTIEEDKLEMRYMNVPDSGSNSLPFEPNESEEEY